MDSLIGALKSKTIWASALVAVLGVFITPVTDWVASHAAWASGIVAALFASLRAMTSTSLADKSSTSAS